MYIESIELKNFRNYQDLQLDFDKGTNIFYGDNEGLVIAEVELDDENEHIELPLWIKEEVTGDIKYYNSNLMSYPYNKWK